MSRLALGHSSQLGSQWPLWDNLAKQLNQNYEKITRGKLVCASRADIGTGASTLKCTLVG